MKRMLGRLSGVARRLKLGVLRVPLPIPSLHSRVRLRRQPTFRANGGQRDARAGRTAANVNLIQRAQKRKAFNDSGPYAKARRERHRRRGTHPSRRRPRRLRRSGADSISCTIDAHDRPLETRRSAASCRSRSTRLNVRASADRVSSPHSRFTDHRRRDDPALQAQSGHRSGRPTARANLRRASSRVSSRSPGATSRSRSGRSCS